MVASMEARAAEEAEGWQELRDLDEIARVRDTLTFDELERLTGSSSTLGSLGRARAPLLLRHLDARAPLCLAAFDR